MKAKITLLACLMLLSAGAARAQYYTVRVNTLALLTGTLNAGFEASLTNKLSLDVATYWNPLNTPHLRAQALAVQAGIRYWLYENYTGHFVGGHLTAARYHVGNSKVHYKGWLAGAGFSYGYAWPLAPRWNCSVEAGLGIYYMNDTRRRYEVPYTEDEAIRRNRRWAVAPSKVEVSFSYLF